jgi:hypothetical protein
MMDARNIYASASKLVPVERRSFCSKPQRLAKPGTLQRFIHAGRHRVQQTYCSPRLKMKRKSFALFDYF